MTKQQAIQRIVDNDLAGYTLVSVMHDFVVEAERDGKPWDEKFEARLSLLYYTPWDQRAVATRQLCRDFGLAIPEELEPRAEQLGLLEAT